MKVDLALQYETGGDLSNFMPNGEWSLIGEREGERERGKEGERGRERKREEERGRERVRGFDLFH